MREIVCDTSPLLYLHQIGQLELLRRLSTKVLVPPAVVSELREGLALGVDVPEPDTIDWIEVHAPGGSAAMNLETDLGDGETEVLALTRERGGAVAVMDDRRARRRAREMGVPVTGTLGILLDGKKADLIENVAPLIDRLQELGFRLAPHTRRAVFRLAGEKLR